MIVRCPICTKGVEVVDGVIKAHVDTISAPCDMSRKHAPACVLREASLEDSADKVVRLAADLRDDLGSFYAQLDLADTRQVREWLVIALAAIDVRRPKSQLFRWVTELDYRGVA